MDNEINFISCNINARDKKLFGFDNDPVIFLKDNWIMAHVMHSAGIFPSVGTARKNGWNKPIPNGFSIFTVGKKRKKVFILNDLKE